jgi:pimeloyl-ACP methyl ester carboxylesterase
VVFLHGFGSNLETWTLTLPTLAGAHRVIAVDLKGFGWSDRPPGDYSPQAQAELVAALMKQLGIERAHIVAHSWGASVALAFVLTHPGRVDKLVLFDAWVYEDQVPGFSRWSRAKGAGEALFALFYRERLEERLEDAYYNDAYVTQDLVEKVEQATKRPGARAAALAVVRGHRPKQLQDRYKTVAHPTLVIWGREDELTTLRFGERLAAELPHADLMVVPRAGHFPMLEAASAVNRKLLAFLAEPVELTVVREVGPAKAPAPAPDGADAPAAAAPSEPAAPNGDEQ